MDLIKEYGTDDEANSSIGIYNWILKYLVIINTWNSMKYIKRINLFFVLFLQKNYDVKQRETECTASWTYLLTWKTLLFVMNIR